MFNFVKIKLYQVYTSSRAQFCDMWINKVTYLYAAVLEMGDTCAHQFEIDLWLD